MQTAGVLIKKSEQISNIMVTPDVQPRQPRQKGGGVSRSVSVHKVQRDDSMEKMDSVEGRSNDEVSLKSLEQFIDNVIDTKNSVSDSQSKKQLRVKEEKPQLSNLILRMLKKKLESRQQSDKAATLKNDSMDGGNYKSYDFSTKRNKNMNKSFASFNHKPKTALSEL